MPTTLTPAQCEQAMEALAKGNDIRSKRAQLKKDLTAGRVRLERIVLDPPAYAESARVHDLLMAVPKVGRVKAARILSRNQMGLSKTIGSLTERQRSELEAELA